MKIQMKISCITFFIFLYYCCINTTSSVFASESADFILIDNNFTEIQQNATTPEDEKQEEANFVEIQKIGESTDFIEANSYCGNSQIEISEKCDTNNFNGKNCQSFGYDKGTLSCLSNCQIISTKNCTNNPNPSPTPTTTHSTSTSSKRPGGGGYIYLPTNTPTPIPTQTPTITTLITPSSTSEPNLQILSDITETQLPQTTPTQTPQQIETEESISTCNEESQICKIPKEENILEKDNKKIIEIKTDIIKQEDNLIFHNSENQKNNNTKNINNFSNLKNQDLKFHNSDNFNFSTEENIYKNQEIKKNLNTNFNISTHTKQEQNKTSKLCNFHNIDNIINNILNTCCWIWILLAFTLGVLTRFIRKDNKNSEEYLKYQAEKLKQKLN